MLNLGMDPFPRELQRLPHHVLGMHQRLHHPDVWVTPTRTASRCLFGVADPEDTRTALDRIIREETVRCIEKWEFDPRTEQPVKNARRFIWEFSREEDRPVPPADAAPLHGAEIGVEDVRGRRGETSDSPAVEVSCPAREGGDDGRLPRVNTDDGAAFHAGDEGERNKAAKRFAPYRQHRMTDYWRKTKSGGETKAKLQGASSDATGQPEGETQQTDGGH